jgi:hypothetical protein
MNYSTLDKEIKEYSEYNKQTIVIISKLSQFFKHFGQQGKKFAKNCQKSFEDFYNELLKENPSSTFYVTYIYFSNNFKQYLKVLEESFESLDKNLGDSLDEYETKFKNSYGEALNKFNDLSNIINEKKEKLEKSKYAYFDSCKASLDMENKIIQLKESNRVVYKDEVNRANEQLLKSIKTMENNEQVYKTEIKRMNKVYEENEEKYADIIKLFRNNNIDKIKFFSSTLKLIFANINQLITKQNEIISKFDRIGDNVKVNRDIILYDEKFNYYNDNKKRFLFEQFLDFKKFKKSFNKQSNSSSQENYGNTTFGNLMGFFRSNNSTNDTSNNLKENENPDEIIKKDIMKKVFKLGRNDEKFIENDDEAKADELFLKQILSKKEKIDENDFKNLMNKIKQNEANLVRFMYVLITFYKTNKIIKIENYDNLKYLSNILDYVLNTCKKNDKLFGICFMVIFVAEKTIYISEDNIYIKHYLCKLLSNNEVFQDPDFWLNLIDQKIEMTTNKNVKVEIEKKEKEKEEERPNTLMTGFKNYFFSNKIRENQKLENEILFRQLYEEKLPQYTVEILEEYMHHFSSFNFEHRKTSELIVDLSTKYKFDNKYVTFFLAQLNSNLYSIKNLTSSVTDGVKELDYDKLFFNTDKRKFKKVLDNKIRCMIYSLKFIEIKELPNLLCLNKTYNTSLLKIIYKNILIKYRDMDIKTHIYIWKIILGYTKIKKEYNYQKILKQLEDNPGKISSNEIIRLDVNRTNFEKDKEINREKISRILRGLSLCCPDVNYSQGMNFIAAFLLNICGDEEEAFYIFLSLLLTSDYGTLFMKELANLKKFFYVFERIIDILLPELYNYLKINNIKVSFFVSPWFITLFTDTYLNIKNRENPRVLLRIWDLFLFSGCKSILKVGISLLKNYEHKIMNLTFEELLRFLISDIPKSDFFQNNSYDNLMKTYINFKIESGLISNIESEYQIKKQLTKGKI